MASDGISKIGAGAGERVGGMVNGTSLAAPGAGGGCRSVEEETSFHNELADVGGVW